MRRVEWRLYHHMGGWIAYHGTTPIRRFMREDDARNYTQQQQQQDDERKSAA